MIHPQALVDPTAEISPGVEIGPFSVIGADVSIGAGTWVGSHVVIKGPTTIGSDNRIYSFSTLGEAPQDKKYQGDPTRLEIGDRNTIREACTLNRGTVEGGGLTRIGSDNWIMAYCHVAHDCLVGDHTIFANAASLAGHVEVQDHAVLGGFTTVHQFCRLGTRCFTGQSSAVTRDVPPYVIVAGNRARAVGINKVGLRRQGFSEDTVKALHRAFRLLIFGSGRREGVDAEIDGLVERYPEVATFVEFVAASERGVVR